MVKRLLLRAIRWYQNTGGSKKHFSIECNFTPTCSEYTHQAISKYGVRNGISLGWKRIKRCNNPDCTQITEDLLE